MTQKEFGPAGSSGPSDLQPPAVPAADRAMPEWGKASDALAINPGRMEALAQISGRIAPALSDLLTVIRGQAGWMLDHGEHDAAQQKPVRQIYAAAEKATSLLRQLLIFSQQHAAHMAAMDLNGLIGETGGVIPRLMGEAISVEFHLSAHLPPILADREMMEQLLLILVLNARDAMPAAGRLHLTTEVAEISADLAKHCADARPGKFVRLIVEDSGRGIAPEILPRIFEPFFTTKADGRSTGLGLATAYGIVKRHQGWISANSVPNRGSIFQVVLPAAPADTAATAASGFEAGNPRGNETILLVEDEADVREFTAMILQKEGYRVLQAASGSDALEAWKWHGARVRLLLTDMVLEDGMNGLELATKLRAENPGLRVICTSGHQREAMKQFPELAGGYLYLQKPCRPETLMAAVRALLVEKPT